MNERFAHFGLLAVAAIVVIYLLMRRTAPASNGSQIADEQVAQPESYPNGNPIDFGGIEIGPSPTNLIFNTVPEGGLLPDVTVGGNPSGSCPCEFDSCEASQNLTILNRIPKNLFQSAADNFAAYQEKIVGAVGQGAPAEAVNY